MATKEVTDFGKSSEAAAAVAAAKARRVPVGSVPMPNMPRLDQPNAAATGAQNARAADRVLTAQERQALADQGRFVAGVGSGYAANQPGMRTVTDAEGNQQEIDPRLAPRPPGSGLRKETVEQLEAVAAANEKSDDEALKDIRKEIETSDDVWETNEFGERVKNLLANKARRSAIEARCQPMSIEDLLMQGFVMQRVPIVPGKVEPTFRSMSGDENLEVLRLMGQLRSGVDQYILDMLSIFKLTCGLHAINNKILPNHLDKDGDFNEDLFKAKLKVVRRMALPILSDFVVNYDWFAKRVQKLTVVDDIKGF